MHRNNDAQFLIGDTYYTLGSLTPDCKQLREFVQNYILDLKKEVSDAMIYNNEELMPEEVDREHFILVQDAKLTADTVVKLAAFHFVPYIAATLREDLLDKSLYELE